MRIPVEISHRMAGINKSLSTAELFRRLAGSTIPTSITALERFEVDLMDFQVSGSGEVPNPTPLKQWAP